MKELAFRAVAVAALGVVGLAALSSLMHGPRQVYASDTGAPAAGADISVRIEFNVSAADTGAAADLGPALGLAQLAEGWRTVLGRWIPMSATRLAARSSSDSVRVFAVRTDSGAAVAIANTSASRAVLDVRAGLSRGPYTIERLGFAADSPETSWRSERLESVILGKDGTLVKPGWLRPGEVAVYRYTNRNLQAAQAFRAAKAAARRLADGHESAYARVMVGLRECEGQLGALTGGIQPSKRADQLKHVHRALLTVAFSESVCRNFVDEGRLPSRTGAELDAALLNLDNALAELSGVCLGLVPSIGVEGPTAAGDRTVTVALTNSGWQTLPTVKLGLTSAGVSVVDQADEAMFRGLAPGQTVRATFHVRADRLDDLQALTGDVAYFAAKTPAHLRLKVF